MISVNSDKLVQQRSRCMPGSRDVIIPCVYCQRDILRRPYYQEKHNKGFCVADSSGYVTSPLHTPCTNCGTCGETDLSIHARAKFHALFWGCISNYAKYHSYKNGSDPAASTPAEAVSVPAIGDYSRDLVRSTKTSTMFVAYSGLMCAGLVSYHINID